MSKRFLKEGGQFFSPDLIIAVGVFIFSMILFFSASNSIFSQTQLVDERKQADEVAHSFLNSLVLSPGYPTSWNTMNISDINSIGLAIQDNYLDENKVLTLINDLNSSQTYSQVKQKMGLGPYSVYLRLVNSEGSEVLGSGIVETTPKLKLFYERIVYYDSKQLILQAIVSLPVGN
jgi:hypothetical protein